MIALVLGNLSDLQMRYLRILEAKKITFMSMAASIVFHYFVCKFFVVNLNMGIVGAALANISSTSVCLLLQYLLVNHVLAA